MYISSVSLRQYMKINCWLWEHKNIIDMNYINLYNAKP